MIARADEIIQFWTDAGEENWFKSDPSFDEKVRARFLATYEAGMRGEFDAWENSPEFALALVLLFDQFPRNMFRGTPKAFASDEKAKLIADRAIAAGHDKAVEPALHTFFYLPFMHSEELADQERCVALMEQGGKPENIKYAEIHLDAIKRFGRFPHRNTILGRKSTPEEVAYLADGGFSG
ncbi:MAG TPA: DUF924 family protein [Xanthobacteraceae bacterium]|nr:DUF924 family protein [Xanthobacteraceae bacterium]